MDTKIQRDAVMIYKHTEAFNGQKNDLIIPMISMFVALSWAFDLFNLTLHIFLSDRKLMSLID